MGGKKKPNEPTVVENNAVKKDHIRPMSEGGSRSKWSNQSIRRRIETARTSRPSTQRSLRSTSGFRMNSLPPKPKPEPKPDEQMMGTLKGFLSTQRCKTSGGERMTKTLMRTVSQNSMRRDSLEPPKEEKKTDLE